MTDDELQDVAALHNALVSDLAKLVKTTYLLRNYAQAHEKSQQAVLDRMDKYHEQCKSFSAVLEALMKLLGEVGGALHAQTERTNKLIETVESYFGDGTGLEQVN